MIPTSEAAIREAHGRMYRRFRDALERERARGISRNDAEIDRIARREASAAVDRMLWQRLYNAPRLAARRGLAL